MKIEGTYKVVGIDELRPNPWNPNSMTKELMEAEKKSIETYGFVDPITVRSVGKSYEIVDGEHRWRAAAALKWPKLPIIDLGVIPDSKAKQLTIVLNETRGKAKPKELAELIQDLAKGGLKLDELAGVTPFTATDLQVMLEGLGSVDHVTRAADGDRPEQTSIKMIVLHYQGKDYEKAKQALEKVMKDRKLKTQAEAAYWLFMAYLKGDVKK